MTIDYDPENAKAMLQPLRYNDKPVVLFAGEAYNVPLVGTLAGAWNSGQEQALKLIQHFGQPTALSQEYSHHDQ